MSTKRKILKKYYSTGWNDGIWPKNDDSTKESFPLTYFQSKSCTNLPETEFRASRIEQVICWAEADTTCSSIKMDGGKKGKSQNNKPITQNNLSIQ